MNNNITISLKRENMWIALLWVFIFMVVLVWDQEKIVVLNLVLFCYFLYYMAGETFAATLEQKANTITESLSADVQLKLSVANSLIASTNSFVSGFSQLLMSVLKKLNVTLTSYLLRKRTNISGLNIKKKFFSLLNLSLFVYADNLNNIVLQQYLFVTNHLSNFKTLGLADISAKRGE